MEFQDFNATPVINVHSASPHSIEAALRDVHRKAPNLQLLIVILSEIPGQYGMLVLESICTSKISIKNYGRLFVSFLCVAHIGKIVCILCVRHLGLTTTLSI